MEQRERNKEIINHNNNNQHHYYDNKTSSLTGFALMSLSAKRRAQCRPSPSRPAEHRFTASTWEEKQSESMQSPTEGPAEISSMQTPEHLNKQNTSGKVGVDKSFTTGKVCMNTNKKNHNTCVLHKAHDTFEDELDNNNSSYIVDNREGTHTYEDNNTRNNNNNNNKYSLSCSRSRESPSSSGTLSSSLLLSNKLEWYRSSQLTQPSQLHHTYHCAHDKRENDSVHLNFARLFSSHQRLLSTTVTEKIKSSKRARHEVRDKESAHINCFRNSKNINNDNNISSSRSKSKSKSKNKIKRNISRKRNQNVKNASNNDGDNSHNYKICSGRNNSHTYNNNINNNGCSCNNKNKIKEENLTTKVANKYNNYALQSARHIRTHSKLQNVPCATTIDYCNNYNNSSANKSEKNSTKEHKYVNVDDAPEKHTFVDVKHTINVKEQRENHNVKLFSEEQMIEEEIKKECEESENSLSASHKYSNSKKNTLLTNSSLLQTSLLPSSCPTTSLVETSILPEMLVHILTEHSQSKQTKVSVVVEPHLCNNTERCHTNNEHHEKYNHSVNEQKSKPRQTELNRLVSKKRQSSKSADKRRDTNKSSMLTTTTTTITTNSTSTTNTKDNQIKSTMKTSIKPAAIIASKEQRRRELYEWNKMLRAAEESGVVTQDAV